MEGPGTHIGGSGRDDVTSINYIMKTGFLRNRTQKNT
jgi:hypothetical protein